MNRPAPSGGTACAAVLIGRNEGARLIASLDALQGQGMRIVYVDSGSTDNSQAAARARGAEVLVLDPDQAFTAARARNTGLFHLLGTGSTPEFIQFLDGDCVLQAGWLSTALAFLRAHPEAAVACGRRRERHPEASLYNRMIDQEWNTPVGQAKACGGDALMRLAALREVGGFNPNLIAGEEPELCVRLRAHGWTIWRLDAEMTLHDAAITRFGQWWQRSRRAGFAYAEGVVMHGRPPERHNVLKLQRSVLWGIVLPVGIVLSSILTSPWALAAALIWPLQIARQYAKGTRPVTALFLTLAKFPEALGALTYLIRKTRRVQARLIEYK